MHYAGHIEQGVVVPDEALDLPDGTRVTIELRISETGPALHPEIERLAGMLPEGIDVDALRLAAIREKHS